MTDTTDDAVTLEHNVLLDATGHSGYRFERLPGRKRIALVRQRSPAIWEPVAYFSDDDAAEHFRRFLFSVALSKRVEKQP